MEHRPVGDRARQIRRVPAARGLVELYAGDPALVIEADPIVDAKIVALAGHHHVVIAVEAKLGWAACFRGGESRDGGEQRRLAFLAAKTAAHPADFHGHRMVSRPSTLATVCCTSVGCWVDE